ncbi:MAG TPA: tail fiber domain-containing protein [Thermoanaerobaculia bacterium]|nr:tail fiber domain-containing protein [Thermoanaerobaculia bacterium]
MRVRRLLSLLVVSSSALCLEAQDAAAEKVSNWIAQPAWSSSEARGALEAQSATDPLPFVGVTPCRIVDTRGNGFGGAYGPPSLSPGVQRSFPLIGQCGIPSGAEAVSLNITVTNGTGPGFVKIFPEGAPPPKVSTLNFVAGQTVANAAIVPLGFGGGIIVQAGVSGTDLIIDTNGYFGTSMDGLGVNTFLGVHAGNATMTGGPNTGIGFGAFAGNTTGGADTAIGFASLQDNLSGSGNVAVGGQSLFKNLTGNGNTAVGNLALIGNVSGSGNVAVGNDACYFTTGDNNICIGNAGAGGQGGTIRIGTKGVHGDTFIAGIFGTSSSNGVGVFVNSQGQLGTDTSSRRFKEEIRDIGEESDGLMRLRPVAFRYKPDLDPAGLQQYGLIAEEVAEVYPDLVAYGADGQPVTVRYHLVNALLLSEVQKQHRAIAELETRHRTEMEALRTRLAELEERIEASRK